MFTGLVCVLGWGPPGLAQSLPGGPTPVERAEGGVAAPKAGQTYDGVVPGPTAKNPLPSAPQGSGAYLVWTGFQMTAGGSQVFLQTTRPVEFDPGKEAKSTRTILLRGCRIHMANNRRKIDTRYFATPVASVSAKQKGHDVEIRITLREPVTVDPHAQAGPDGSQFVVFDFPPGKAAPEPSALQDLAAAAPPQGGNRAIDDDEGAAAPKPDKARKGEAKAAAKSSR